MTLSVSVKKSLPEFQIDCTFELQKGLSVLFGYSGSGKSLTLKLVSGLMTPDSGKITLDDKVLFDSKKRTNLHPGKRRIGYVFQENNLFPHMTCKENILFGARRIGRDRGQKKLHSLLERFRIEKIAESYPEEISGGQKKRVALAMALIGEPDLLLLDEPFSALDNPLRNHLRSCLTGVMRHLDIPVVLVTHDIIEALMVADHMVVLSHGKVVQEGSPQEVVKNPADENIALLLQLPALVSHPKQVPTGS